MSEMDAETARLQNLILGKEIVDRINELGAISETRSGPHPHLPDQGASRGG